MMKKPGLMFILFCISAVFLLSACDKDDYQKALKAEENGDHETAIELFTKLAKKNYEDSASQLEAAVIRQTIGLMEADDWDHVDCYRFWGRDDLVFDVSGIPDMTNRCFYQKARYLQDHGRNEEALDVLRSVNGKGGAPEGFDHEQMVFENSFAVCQAAADPDEQYQCLLDLAPYELQFHGPGSLSDYYKEKNVFYADEAVGKLLFWRDEIGGSGPVEQMDFSGYMDQCQKNRGIWHCAVDRIFDMIYFADQDPVRAYQDAVDWARQQDGKEALEWVEGMPSRCIVSTVPSAYTGIAFPIDAPAECGTVFRPELDAWLRENTETGKPAEGFWNSDTFYETFGFDTTDPGFSGIGTIKHDFRAEDPYPRSIAVIVSSACKYYRPDESWKDDPEMTEDIVRWVNDTAAVYKKWMPDWTFIDDPSRAAYILYFSMNWEQTGTFSGKAGGKDVKVSVYNLRISAECWENREHGWRNKIITRSTDLGQENTIQGVQKDLVAQHLIISSEDPLTFAGADYDPETGIAWAVSRPLGYSDEMAEWLKTLESEYTVTPAE